MRKLLCNYSLSQLQFWHVWMNPPSAALTGACSHCRRSWIPVKGLVTQPPGHSHVPEWGGRNGAGRKNPVGICVSRQRSMKVKETMIQTCQDVQRRVQSYFLHWKTHEVRICCESNQSHLHLSLHVLQLPMRPVKGLRICSYLSSRREL